MTISENLDALRKSRNSVETATYLDLSSGTVLYASTAVRQPQERLDALCSTARALFDEAADGSAEAVSFGPTEALVFCRSGEAPTEAICLVCAPDVDLADILQAAHRALEAQGA